MLKIILALLLFAAIAAEIYVLTTGSKVILWQDKSMQGEPVAALGNAPAAYDMLVCRHFDGRGVRVSLYRYAGDDLGGFSRCPLLVPDRSVQA